MKLTYYRNDTVGIKMKFRNKATLQPIDLTGKTLTLTVDPSENPLVDTANLMQLNGVVFGAATDGVAIFTPAGTDSDFEPGNYFFDVEMKNTSDGLEKQTLTKDEFEHLQDITK